MNFSAASEAWMQGSVRQSLALRCCAIPDRGGLDAFIPLGEVQAWASVTSWASRATWPQISEGC
jgi:hypothetical protein